MKFATSLRSFTAGCLTGVLLAGSGSMPTIADTLSYDPESCATPAEGMVYLAFDRIVLRVPANELTLIGDLPPERLVQMPSPPNPSEPEGCPDHPIRAANFTFSYLYEAIRANKRDPQLPPYSPNKLKLIIVRQDYWGLQPMAEESFERTCDRYQQRETLSNGLVVCLHPPKDNSIPREHWGGVLQAPPEVYSAPFRRPFVVYCHPFGNGSQTCQVDYKLYKTLNVFYNITVQHQYSSRFIPLTEVIEFDRGLRAKIEAARVKDFVWPDLQ